MFTSLTRDVFYAEKLMGKINSKTDRSYKLETLDGEAT